MADGRPDLFDLTGKVALVTGASGAIGGAIARGLHDFGADVYASGRSTERLADLGLAQDRQMRADLAQAGVAQLLLRNVLDRAGALHVLVNAAGTSRETWEETLAVNLTAVHRLCEAAGRHMIERSIRGSIINVTSIAGHRGFPENPSYVASKGGLVQLTRALARDWGRAGIRVNNLCPGSVRTPTTEASFQDPTERREREDRTLLGRWGEPADLVGAAVFLASDGSSYVTGADIVVDGGWLAKGM